MSAEEMVDASLAGLDQQEANYHPVVTEPRGLAEVRRCPPRSRSQPLAQAGGRSLSDPQRTLGLSFRVIDRRHMIGIDGTPPD